MAFIKRAIVPIKIEDTKRVEDWANENEEDIDLATHRRLAMAKLAVKQAKVFKPTEAKAASKPKAGS